MGNLVLNLWDCGGQYRFYESYFDSQRDTVRHMSLLNRPFIILPSPLLHPTQIFRNVEVLIYVFDIESAELEADFQLFDGVVEAMEQNSPEAAIFVLIHKMDLVPEIDRMKVFNEREARIKERSQQYEIIYFNCCLILPF
jgi:Ras-related GTP-binding protein A/B